MNNYKNLNRPGTRTSTSINPMEILEDIDQKIRRLDPNATPLQTLGNIIGRGPKPKNVKVKVKAYHGYDNFDYCSSVKLGTGNYARFALLRLDQISRPTVKDSMYYYPQDTMFIVETGQKVEVVMNPVTSIKINGGYFSMPDNSLTEGTVSTTADGTVLVRAVTPEPIKPFTQSWVITMGRTIYESQNIEAVSKQRDFVYDCNFVEHKEAVFSMTEDQKNWIKTKGTVPDWTFQQEETMKELKIDVEYNAIFSERHIDFTERGRPKPHMMGLFHAIKTNVSAYDPMSVVDFEAMFSNFLYQQAFRYNPNGFNKMGICGGRFLYNFNIAFREYRRTDSVGANKIGKDVGLDLNTYVLPGQHKVTLTRNEVLRMDTPLENWCFVIDPSLMEWRIVKDYESRYYQADYERDEKIMIEWQGTIAFHLEQAHALLRTF